MSGRLIAVVGPSGVGKDSVIEALADRAGLVRARRVITRPGDAGGEDFDGITAAMFEKCKSEGVFALDWAAHGLKYAIPKEVESDLAGGRDVVANLSRGVLRQAARRFPGMVVIALTATPATLAARLSGRGRESAAEIERRLARADYPLPEGIVAHRISNDGHLSETVAAVLAVLYPVRA